MPAAPAPVRIKPENGLARVARWGELAARWVEEARRRNEKDVAASPQSAGRAHRDALQRLNLQRYAIVINAITPWMLMRRLLLRN